MIAAFLLLLAASAYGATPAPTTSTVATAIDSDSRQTRDELITLLRHYPPQLGMVLKLDPTLLSNQSYLANYPALATFVTQHADVVHNPAFYLETIYAPADRDLEPPSMRTWRLIIGDFGGFLVFLIITGVLIWMVKTLIEQRRWNRLSNVQTEVHSKLLDRFTSNEELLAYIKTPAGRRFFESAPFPLEAGPRPMSAPVGRIFWSLQAGLVMIAIGIGFDLVSMRVPGSASDGLYGIGVVALLVGVALVLSAIIFYALSRRFGLWQPPAVTAAPNGD